MYLEQRLFAMGACNRVSTRKQTFHLSSLMTELSQKPSAVSVKSLDSNASSWIRTLTDLALSVKQAEGQDRVVVHVTQRCLARLICL